MLKMALATVYCMHMLMHEMRKICVCVCVHVSLEDITWDYLPKHFLIWCPCGRDLGSEGNECPPLHQLLSVDEQATWALSEAHSIDPVTADPWPEEQLECSLHHMYDPPQTHATSLCVYVQELSYSTEYKLHYKSKLIHGCFQKWHTPTNFCVSQNRTE